MNNNNLTRNNSKKDSNHIYSSLFREGFKKTIWYLVLTILALIIMIPFIWMVSTSFKNIEEIFKYPPTWLPENINFSNYRLALTAAPFPRYFLNSAIVAITVTIGQLISCTLAAFAFARLEFKGKNILFMLFLSTTMISTQVTLVPSYLIIQNLNWIDTYQALIIPFIANAFGVFMLRQAFSAIPREIEDAAKIDGCSRLRFLWQIIVPLAKPALAAQALFAFMGNWNSYLWPLIVTNRQEMRTLQIGLRYFINQEGGTEWGIYMATAVLVTLPVIIIYFVVQKSFIEGIATTGLKG